MIFMDEPSSFRPDGPPFDSEHAASGLIASSEAALLKIEGPVALIGLSFGAIVAEHLASKFPQKSSEMIFISPTENLLPVFLKMMQIAESDYQKIDPGTAVRLKQIRLKVQQLFDSYCQEGLALTFKDPLLFGHYWQNPSVMQTWIDTLSLPEFALDTLSQQMIYLEMSRRDPFQKLGTSNIPAQLIFGEFDPVMDRSSVLNTYGRKFKQLRTTTFEHSGHFPHLEEPEKFLALLK